MRTIFLIATACATILTGFAVPTGNVPIIKQAGEVVPHSYIVKLKHSVSRDSHIARLLSSTSDAKVEHKFDYGLHGYSVKLKGKDLDYVRQSSDVEEIFEEGILKLKYDDSEIPREAKSAAEHIRRHRPSVVAPHGTGHGVNIYMVYSGIDIAHPCFDGNAFNPPQLDTRVPGFESDQSDQTGYSTYFACVAARTAPHAKIISMKFWSGHGRASTGSLIHGIGRVMLLHIRSEYTPSIINIPFPLSRSQGDYLEQVLRDAKDQGIHLVVAAGEEARDCSEEFVNMEGAKVGAVDEYNEMIDRSSYGEFITIWAPGSHPHLNVRIDNVRDTTRLIGSGSASAYVAGLLAVEISRYGNKLPGELLHDLKHYANPANNHGIDPNHRARGVPDGTTNLLAAEW